MANFVVHLFKEGSIVRSFRVKAGETYQVTEEGVLTPAVTTMTKPSRHMIGYKETPKTIQDAEVFIGEEAYDWLQSRGTWKASNGFGIHVDSTDFANANEFVSSVQTLFMNSNTFRGNRVCLSSLNFPGIWELLQPKQLECFKQALKELAVAKEKSKPVHAAVEGTGAHVPLKSALLTRTRDPMRVENWLASLLEWEITSVQELREVEAEDFQAMLNHSDFHKKTNLKAALRYLRNQ
jgi:hypothetical protein